MEPTHFESLYPKDTRKTEIEKAIEILRTGRSCQIIGLPGVGKSNVLRLITYNKEVRLLHLGADQEKFHFIYMDFSEVAERPIFDVIKFIFISLSYSLGERGLGDLQEIINGFLKEALTFNDELILFQGLKKSVDFLAKEKGLNLVFLFDRFEAYIPSIDNRFFLNLKLLQNRARYQFLTIFGVTRPIEDTLDVSIFSEFHEFLVGNAVYLPIKDPVGLAFRFEYLEKITGKKAPEKIKDEIIALTGGQGKLAKLCYEAVLAEQKHEDLEELFLSKRQIRGALYEIWQFLTPEEQDDVRTGAENEFLEKIGLLNAKIITIPLFESFVKTLPKEAKKEEIKYDAEKNEIIKGNEILTEKLTPSEFRLLRFLISNTGKVCEKDALITNVWKDTKTQEGVTDQALDQIIYRLRKKIETDPNNPHFIHTVKGRGYRFGE